MKKNVVLKLSGLSTEGLINLGNTIVEKMTGNGNFPTPPVSMDDLKKAIEDLTSAYADAKFSRSKVEFAKVRTFKAALMSAINQEAEYVDWVAKGNEEIILSAGMNVSKNRQKHPAPSQVTDLVGVFTGIPGTILLRWKRSAYSKMFQVFMTTTPDVAQSWKLIDTITTRRLMVENVASSTKFYFKVVPVNAAGVGPDSEIAEAIAA
ncbi:MAG TPA: fibronectin type III domain-containing protein [Bacteroidia bacterium]|nr:fibronectin type III domain-containing protein [Bacteroidia bacterium]HNU33321.1 fibronectin type III domain-containing protein [Bacteroidia bacterium]